MVGWLRLSIEPQLAPKWTDPLGLRSWPVRCLFLVGGAATNIGWNLRNAGQRHLSVRAL